MANLKNLIKETTFYENYHFITTQQMFRLFPLLESIENFVNETDTDSTPDSTPDSKPISKPDSRPDPRPDPSDDPEKVPKSHITSSASITGAELLLIL